MKLVSMHNKSYLGENSVLMCEKRTIFTYAGKTILPRPP